MPDANDSKTPSPRPRPTGTRHWILLFAAALAIITYIDRVCISQAAGDIQRDLGLTKVQMGWAFAAFAWAYALFEIPGGWLGDTIGPRKVLMRVVVWWSLFTAATGWAWNLASLLVTRFLFGAGEAGCFPNLAKMFTNWLPRDERSRAVGVMWLSARWGGAFTPLLVVWVFSLMTWRRAFVVFGAIGIVWAIWFYRWFRDNPRDHKSVNAAELELLAETQQNSAGHADVPWGKLLRSRTVLLLWLQYFFFSWGWYFYITWLPTYLKEAHGPGIKDNVLLSWIPSLLGGFFRPEMIQALQVALLAGFPLFFGGLGSWIGGTVANRLAGWTGGLGRARRLVAYFGFVSAAGLMILFIYLKDPVWAMLSMGLASFVLDLTLAGSWGACMDVGGKYAGTVSGSMNMAGNIAGGVAPVVVGYILDHTGRNWPLTFWISVAIYLLGGLCWKWIDPVTPLEKADEARSR
jgi:MFS transporter, ACS family, glucarate transporter